MDIEYLLIARVIKYWRSNSEERALAEHVLYLLGLEREDTLHLTVEELANEIANETIRRTESQGCQQESKQKQVQGEKEICTVQEEEVLASNLCLNAETQPSDIGLQPESLPQLTAGMIQPGGDLEVFLALGNALEEMNNNVPSENLIQLKEDSTQRIEKLTQKNSKFDKLPQTERMKKLAENKRKREANENIN